MVVVSERWLVIAVCWRIVGADECWLLFIVSYGIAKCIKEIVSNIGEV